MCFTFNIIAFPEFDEAKAIIVLANLIFSPDISFSMLIYNQLNNKLNPYFALPSHLKCINLQKNLLTSL